MGACSQTDTLKLTRHSRERMAQRAIPVSAIELMWAHGSTARCKGADSYFFDKHARHRLAHDLGRERVSKIEKYLNAYVVVSDDGTVITTGWRTRRLRRR